MSMYFTRLNDPRCWLAIIKKQKSTMNSNLELNYETVE